MEKYEKYESVLSSLIESRNTNFDPLNEEVEKLLLDIITEDERRYLSSTDIGQKVSNKFKADPNLTEYHVQIFNNDFYSEEKPATDSKEFYEFKGRHLMLDEMIYAVSCVAISSETSDEMYIRADEFKKDFLETLITLGKTTKDFVKRVSYRGKKRNHCFCPKIGQYSNIDIYFETSIEFDNEKPQVGFNNVVNGYFITDLKSNKSEALFNGIASLKDLSDYISNQIKEANNIKLPEEHTLDNNITVQIIETFPGYKVNFLSANGQQINKPNQSRDYENKYYDLDVPPSTMLLMPYTAWSVVSAVNERSFGPVHSQVEIYSDADVEKLDLSDVVTQYFPDTKIGVKIVPEIDGYTCYTYYDENEQELHLKQFVKDKKGVRSYINNAIRTVLRSNVDMVVSVKDEDLKLEDLNALKKPETDLTILLTGKTPHDVAVIIYPEGNKYNMKIRELGRKKKSDEHKHQDRDEFYYDHSSQEWAEFYPKLSEYLSEKGYVLPTEDFNVLLDIVNFIKHKVIGTSDIIVKQILEANKGKKIKFYYTSDKCISQAELNSDLNWIKKNKRPIYYLTVQSSATENDALINDAALGIIEVRLDGDKIRRRYFILDNDTRVIRPKTSSEVGEGTELDKIVRFNDLLDNINKSIKFDQNK